MTPLERIKNLLPSLPDKDRKYADNFIKEREFNKLYELVKSDITILEKKYIAERKSEVEISILMNDITDLAVEVADYCKLIGGFEEDYSLESEDDSYIEDTDDTEY